jgi:hypothetical protein
MDYYLSGRREASSYVKRLDASFRKKKPKKASRRNQFKGKCPTGKTWVVNAEVKNGGFCRKLTKGTLASDDESNDFSDEYQNAYGTESYLSDLEKYIIDTESGGEKAINGNEWLSSKDESVRYERDVANILNDSTIDSDGINREIEKCNRFYESGKGQNIFGTSTYLTPLQERNIKNTLLADEEFRKVANHIAKQSDKETAVQFLKDIHSTLQSYNSGFTDQASYKNDLKGLGKRYGMTFKFREVIP